MVLSDYRWQGCPDTGISTGAYNMFYQSVPINHCTHVPDTSAQYSASIEYNVSCTTGMELAHFIMLNNELMNKDPDVVPEQILLIILDRK